MGPRRAAPRAGLLGIRKELGLFANLRPVRAIPALAGASPLKDVEGVDLLVVRELTGGIYFGDKEEGTEHASDLCAYSREEVERIARVAFSAAPLARHQRRQGQRARHRAACGAPSITELHAERVPRTSSSSTCSSTTPRCSSSPTRAHFDVIVTENMFGDILSDEASILTGSIGLLPSASPRRRRPRPVRARPRLGARHRRPGRSPTRWR